MMRIFQSPVYCFALLLFAAPWPARAAVELDMSSSALVVAPGEQAALSLRLTGIQAASSRHSAQIEIRDSEDALIATRETGTLQVDAAGKMIIPLELEQPGYYSIQLTLDHDTSATLQTSAVVAPPVGPVGSHEGRFGVYAHGSSEQIESIREDGYYALMGKVGARWATTDLWWRDVQPDGPEQWDWTIADRRFADLKSAGITPIPHLFGIPQWASSHAEDDAGGADGLSFHVYPPKDWDAWARFVEAFVTRYGQDLKYLRIWNEPDSQYWMGTPEEFAKLLKIAYETAHRVKPDIQILVDTALAKMSYYEALEQVGGGGYYDILSIHNYQLEKVLPPEQTMFAEGYSAAAAWRDRVRPGLPLWESEVCWLAEPWSDPSWYGQGELDQARYLVRGAMLALGAGVEKVIWFPFHSWRWEENGKAYQHSGGLVRADCSPRPAFAAYRTLSAQLGEATPTGWLDMPSPTARGLGFTVDNQSITVLWSTEAEGEWITLNVGGELSAGVISLFGAGETLPAHAGKISLKLTPSPVYVRTLQAPKRVDGDWSFNAWQVKAQAVVDPASDTLSLPVQIANALHGPRRGELRLEGPGNFVSSPERVIVGAESTANVTLRMPGFAALSTSATAARLVFTEASGARQVLPLRLTAPEVKAPLWRADKPARRVEFMRDVASGDPVRGLSFSFPSGIAYDVELEVREREGGVWTSLGRQIVQDAYRVQVGRAISAYRLVFHQLINDPSFEQEATLPNKHNAAGSHWWNAAARKYITLAGDVPHTGQRYVDIQSTGRSKVDPWSNVQQWIPVKPNTEYSFTAYARFKSTHDAWAALYVTGIERLLPHSFAIYPYIDDAWHRIFLTVRTEAEQTRLRVSCALVGDGHFMYDDVMAIEGRIATDIPQVLDVVVHTEPNTLTQREEEVTP